MFLVILICIRSASTPSRWPGRRRMQRHVGGVGRHSRQVGRDRVAPQRKTRRVARDVRHQRLVHRQEGQAHA